MSISCYSFLDHASVVTSHLLTALAAYCRRSSHDGPRAGALTSIIPLHLSTLSKPTTRAPSIGQERVGSVESCPTSASLNFSSVRSTFQFEEPGCEQGPHSIVCPTLSCWLGRKAPGRGSGMTMVSWVSEARMSSIRSQAWKVVDARK